MEVKNQYVKLGDDLPCDYCGKVRYFKRFEIEKYKNHFCSGECRNLWLGRNREDNKSHSTCVICGSHFSYPKSYYKDRVTCSNPCKGVWVNTIQSKKKGLNKLEVAGGNILRELGVPFHEQYLIENKFLVDVFIPDYNLVIQWDGRYWHSLPKRKSLDKSQDSYMRKCGYKILRFNDYEVYNKTSQVKEKINEILSN